MGEDNDENGWRLKLVVVLVVVGANEAGDVVLALGSIDVGDVALVVGANEAGDVVLALGL